MLRVTVELVPFGDEAKLETIATMVIANDNTGNLYTSNYETWLRDYRFSKDKFARLADFDRGQTVWELIRRLLEAALLEKHIPDEKKDSVSQRLKKRLK